MMDQAVANTAKTIMNAVMENVKVDSEEKTMKVGIIRCMQTEDICPGTADFRAIREKTGVFSGVTEEIECIGFVNCGGCPGKKAVLRSRELVRRGADTIAFASCIQKGTPIGYP